MALRSGGEAGMRLPIAIPVSAALIPGPACIIIGLVSAQHERHDGHIDHVDTIRHIRVLVPVEVFQIWIARSLPPSLFELRRNDGRYAAPVSLLNQPFGAAAASAGASASPPTTAPNEAKNSPASFFAVESIKRWPSCASLPPICASTS